MKEKVVVRLYMSVGIVHPDVFGFHCQTSGLKRLQVRPPACSRFVKLVPPAY